MRFAKGKAWYSLYFWGEVTNGKAQRLFPSEGGRLLKEGSVYFVFFGKKNVKRKVENKKM